jgi:hypothetical protein
MAEELLRFQKFSLAVFFCVEFCLLGYNAV